MAKKAFINDLDSFDPFKPSLALVIERLTKYDEPQSDLYSLPPMRSSQNLNHRGTPERRKVYSPSIQVARSSPSRRRPAPPFMPPYPQLVAPSPPIFFPQTSYQSARSGDPWYHPLPPPHEITPRSLSGTSRKPSGDSRISSNRTPAPVAVFSQRTQSVASLEQNPSPSLSINSPREASLLNEQSEGPLPRTWGWNEDTLEPEATEERASIGIPAHEIECEDHPSIDSIPVSESPQNMSQVHLESQHGNTINGPSTALRTPSLHSVSKRSVHSSRISASIPEKKAAIPSPSTPEAKALPAPIAMNYATAFLFDTLPRQVYLHCHFRLPYMYFSRINHIFRTAGLEIEGIKWGILDEAMREQEDLDDPGPWTSENSQGDPAYDRLQRAWNSLIDSLLREWSNLNIISALLLAAILTVLQIDTAASDPLPRYTGFMSMICALISLLCGYIYIIRFESMRSNYKVLEWANEVQSLHTGIWWNMWIFLALPASWLVWSIILYVTCAMSLIWRSGTGNDENRLPMTSNQALAGRVVITTLLAIGIIYLILVVLTLRRFGEKMDRDWHWRLVQWVEDTQRGMGEDGMEEHREAPPTPIIDLDAFRRSPQPLHTVQYDAGYPSYMRPRSSPPVQTIQISS